MPTHKTLQILPNQKIKRALMSYTIMYSTIAETLIKEDKIQIVDSPNPRPPLEIKFYKYEDRYCIMVYKRQSDSTMYSVCRFKGKTKIKNKIMLIDFYQIPPIKPALFILFNGKVEVFIRKTLNTNMNAHFHQDQTLEAGLKQYSRQKKH